MNKHRDLMLSALAQPNGLVVDCLSNQEAHLLRRNLYRARDKARSLGHADFDELSFVLEDVSLKIVRRDRITKLHQPRYAARPLTVEELPTQICARGMTKPPLSSILMHSMMVEEMRKAAKGLTYEELVALIPPAKTSP